VQELTKEFLLWLFYYDRENGKLYWKNHWAFNRAKALIGKEAGTVNLDGYLKITIDYKIYSIHTIIYFIENNIWPPIVDHIDGDKLNNKITNLRSVTQRKNVQNLDKHRSGKLVGAIKIKGYDEWRSRIHVDGKQRHLGYFNTELEAHQRYVQELKARGLV